MFLSELPSRNTVPLNVDPFNVSESKENLVKTTNITKKDFDVVIRFCHLSRHLVAFWSSSAVIKTLAYVIHYGHLGCHPLLCHLDMLKCSSMAFL
jgi:hypothetical protein